MGLHDRLTACAPFPDELFCSNVAVSLNPCNHIDECVVISDGNDGTNHQNETLLI